MVQKPAAFLYFYLPQQVTQWRNRNRKCWFVRIVGNSTLKAIYAGTAVIVLPVPVVNATSAPVVTKWLKLSPSALLVLNHPNRRNNSFFSEVPFSRVGFICAKLLPIYRPYIKQTILCAAYTISTTKRSSRHHIYKRLHINRIQLRLHWNMLIFCFQLMNIKRIRVNRWNREKVCTALCDVLVQKPGIHGCVT